MTTDASALPVQPAFPADPGPIQFANEHDNLPPIPAVTPAAPAPTGAAPVAVPPSDRLVAFTRRQLATVAVQHRTSAIITGLLALASTLMVLVALMFAVVYLYLNMLAAASQDNGFAWLVAAREYHVNSLTITLAIFLLMHLAARIWLKVPSVRALRVNLAADTGEPVLDPPPGARWGDLRTESEFSAARMFMTVVFAWSVSGRQALREWRQAKRIASSNPVPAATVIALLRDREGSVSVASIAALLGTDLVVQALPTLYELPDVLFRFADPQSLCISENSKTTWLNAEVA